MALKTAQDVGLLIRQNRKQLGLSQQDLAQKVGVSRWWIIEIERGKPRAELGLVLKTFNALQINLIAENTPEPQSIIEEKPQLSDVLARARSTFDNKNLPVRPVRKLLK